MSSVFKCWCGIYWITFLLSLSYALGMFRYRENHVIPDSMMESQNFKMKLLTICNITFALCGCVLLKCNVTNLFCVVLYGIPVGILIPALAIWGIHDSSNSVGTPPLNVTFDLVKSHYAENGMWPRWLTQTEDEFKCCGLEGPSDYRQMLREIGKEKCLQEVNDIPCSCCKGRKLNKDRLRGFSNCVEDSDFEHCSKNGSKLWMQRVVSGNSSLDEKCSGNATSNSGAGASVQTSENLFTTGCFKSLRNCYASVKSAMMAFFVIHAICAFGMLLGFARNCCHSSTITGHKSDYSLDVDVETLSLLDATQQNSQRNSGPPKY